MDKSLYIVIPCYNEQEVLPITASALSGQLGRLSGVSTKTVYSHKLFECFDFEGEYNE